MNSQQINLNEYPSLCQGCVYRLHPIMLSTYCIPDCICDGCGRVGLLALCRFRELRNADETQPAAQLNSAPEQTTAPDTATATVNVSRSNWYDFDGVNAPEWLSENEANHFCSVLNAYIPREHSTRGCRYHVLNRYQGGLYFHLLNRPRTV